MSHSDRPGVAFYCVCNDRYFLGAVGMLNSLRLMGHAEPVYMLDCGLTPAQRELLAPHVTLVPAPGDGAPQLLKTVAPLRHPAEVMVLIDVDMILTRPLTELADAAWGGRVVAFRNNLDRFVPEWGELLDLGPVRRQPYLSSGLVVMGGSTATDVLRVMDDRQTRVDFDLTYVRRGVVDYPFLLLEQDVLNPILASRVETERIVALEKRLAPDPPFPGLRLVDEEALRCAYEDGAEPYVLHFLAVRKPWLDPMHRDIYALLLARLLVGSRLAVRVPQKAVPLRMRSGLLAGAERARVDVRDRLGWLVRNHLPESLMARIDTRRRSSRAGA